MLTDKTLVEFLAETASENPVPGGGSMAAFSGASAAALTEMVANLTQGKKNYEAVSEEMLEIAKKAAMLRALLILDVDRDSQAYGKVMAAYKLPKETEEEKAQRSMAIQAAMKIAASVPLEVAQRSRDVILLARSVVTKGNKNAITDGAVSGMLARTAVLAAIYNVKINLDSIKDAEFVLSASKEIQALETQVHAIEREILDHMKESNL